MTTFLQKIRKKRDFSQEYLAEQISVSRQTFSQIENGERELNITEARKLAEIFDLSLTDFLDEKEKSVPAIVSDNNSPELKPEIRISVPQKNLEKFKEVLLYILEKVGAKSNVGETVLYKLLYFIDFDFYEKYEEQLIGATYIKNNYGPTPIEFKKIIEDMQKNNEIEVVKSKYFKYPQRKYLLTPKSKKSKYLGNNLSIREEAEKKLIDEVLNHLSDMTASQISDYSHEDIPWKSHLMGEVIEYESVFYRNNNYSVRKNSDEL